MSKSSLDVSVEYRKCQYATDGEYFKYSGRQWRINNKHSGVFTKMLKRIFEQIFVMFSYDTKLFVARFDLHQSVAISSSSRHLSEFLQSLKSELRVSHGLKYFGYVWCREESETIKQHYHLALLLEGHKIRSPHNLLSIMQRLWVQSGGSSVYRANYHNLHREDYESIADVIFHLSYLAKVEGKTTLSPNFKAFSASRLKLKQSKIAP